jgi:N,N'-diacetyllegionaminate synthase
MIIESINTDEDIMIIAEIGNNHEGNYKLAEEMIGMAADAGADAVKFQTFKTEYYISRSDEARFNRLKSFELNKEEFHSLSKVAKDKGLLFLSTPFDLESVDVLENIVDAYKISSGDNNFYPLIEAVAAKKKPVLLSGGLADVTQLSYSKSLIERTWSELSVNPGLALLHCVSSYPVPPEETNLSSIGFLADKMECDIGYSDHALGIQACIVAVALGARIIEKHFTIDKNYSDFRDHQLSADPSDMKQLVDEIRNTQILMGSRQKIMQNSEKGSATAMRRSIATKRNLVAGESLTMSDITWIRPGDGIPPGAESLILGRKLTQNVSEGDILKPEFFE